MALDNLVWALGPVHFHVQKLSHKTAAKGIQIGALLNGSFAEVCRSPSPEPEPNVPASASSSEDEEDYPSLPPMRYFSLANDRNKKWILVTLTLICESWKNPKRGTIIERFFRLKSRAQHWIFFCIGLVQFLTFRNRTNTFGFIQPLSKTSKSYV